MQEHRKKSMRRARRFANANFELDATARSSVFGVIDSFDGGEDPAYSHLKREFVTKFCDDSLVPSADRRANAIRKFLDCEEINAVTNHRLDWVDPGYNILPRVGFSSFLRFARRLIRDILGPLRNELVLGGFTGGASTSRPRTEGHPALKFSGKADITEAAVPYLELLLREAPLLRQYNALDPVRIVEGSVLFTVPKKTDIDRCACKEPDVNMFLQKGVGNHIRRRLRRFGINLNDQSRNRGLAQLGSLDGSLATLDLSSASDRISRVCVELLLPAEWYLYLDDIRSHVVEIDGVNHRMEMFSSMGNGFTFELESLIFFALMRTVAYFEGTPGIVSIYGDDIVIPSGMAPLASHVLSEFGFAVNEDKSFSSGPFRESCGGHYHNGIDITPFYLKRGAERLTDVIRVANQLRRWAFADAFRQYTIPGLYSAWRNLANLVPSDLWGGHDYSVDTQLVSPPRGRYKLVRVQEPKRLPAKGEYLFWHNTNWNRTQPADEAGTEPASTNQICRRRRANLGAPVTDDWFFEELIAR